MSRWGRGGIRNQVPRFAQTWSGSCWRVGFITVFRDVAFAASAEAAGALRPFKLIGSSSARSMRFRISRIVRRALERAACRRRFGASWDPLAAGFVRRFFFADSSDRLDVALIVGVRFAIEVTGRLHRGRRHVSGRGGLRPGLLSGRRCDQRRGRRIGGRRSQNGFAACGAGLGSGRSELRRRRAGLERMRWRSRTRLVRVRHEITVGREHRRRSAGRAHAAGTTAAPAAAATALIVVVMLLALRDNLRLTRWLETLPRIRLAATGIGGSSLTDRRLGRWAWRCAAGWESPAC